MKYLKNIKTQIVLIASYIFRQQERHLGIIKSLDAPTTRKKHDVHSFIVNKDDSFYQNTQSSNTPLRYLDIQSSQVVPIESVAATNILNSTGKRMPKFYEANADILPLNINDTADIKATKLIEVESWVLATPTVTIQKREITDREVLQVLEEREDLIDIPLEEDSTNETMLFKREILKPEQQPPVHVHIQNITEVSRRK